MLNYAVVSTTLMFAVWAFRKDYLRGVCLSLFFLLLWPRSVGIDLGSAFPFLTIHRLLALTWIFFWAEREGPAGVRRRIQFLGILMLITLCMVASLPTSSNLGISIKRTMYFVVEGVGVFILVRTSLKCRETTEKVIKAIMTGLMAVALVGVFERFSGINIGELVALDRPDLEVVARPMIYADDVTSTYVHRILFGVAMCCGMIWTLCFIDRKEGRPAAAWYWGLFFVFSSGLYFSFSRGPWIAFCLSLGFMGALAPKKFIKKAAVIFALVAAVFVVRPGTLSTIEALGTSTENLDSVRGSSFVWRFRVWEMAVKKAGEASIARFLVGHGKGSQLIDHFGPVEFIEGRYTEMISWDNQYAIILYEQGILGLTLSIWLYLAILKRGATRFKREGSKDILMIGALGCVLTFAFMKTNVDLFAPQLSYLEYATIAIVSFLLENRRVEEAIPKA